jgi:hypothetical protein
MEKAGAIPEEQRFNNLFDRVDTTSTTWLGLTMACAQCHDHKFDPITQRDYFSLLASFNQLSENGLAGNSPTRMRVAEPFLEIASEENKKWMAEKEAKVKEAEEVGRAKEKFELALVAWRSALTPDSRTGNPPYTEPLPGEITALLRIEESARTKEQKEDLSKRLRQRFEQKVWPSIAGSDPATKEIEALKKEIARYKFEEVPRVMVMRDDKPRETFLLDRGSYERRRERSASAPLASSHRCQMVHPRIGLGFAQWLFTPEHPLTAACR